MMSSSQLEIEFESMIDRHELYAKYGIAAEAAQLFETELGTLLLCVRGLENGWHIVPDGAEARKVLDAIDRSKRWSRKFGPVVKVDRLYRKTIQNDETKEPFS